MANESVPVTKPSISAHPRPRLLGSSARFGYLLVLQSSELAIIMNRVHIESIIDRATRWEVALQNMRGGPGMLPTNGPLLEETRWENNRSLI
jgi:hypothetical protein